MAKQSERERDEVVSHGADHNDLVAPVEHHIAKAHPDLAGKVSREHLLAAASEASAMRSAGVR